MTSALVPYYVNPTLTYLRDTKSPSSRKKQEVENKKQFYLIQCALYIVSMQKFSELMIREPYLLPHQLYLIEKYRSREIRISKANFDLLRIFQQAWSTPQSRFIPFVNPGRCNDEDEGFFLVERPKEVMGMEGNNVAKKISEHILNYAWSYTFGWFESHDVRDFEWKIKRFEDLIIAMQENVVSYVDSQPDLKNLDSLMDAANKEDAPEWMRQILPVLRFCQKDISTDDHRFNLGYLEKIRDCYNHGLLSTLRQAAEWAKQNPETEGVEHINTICYLLYAAVNLNRRCHRILDTFLMLGNQGIKNKQALPRLRIASYPLLENIIDIHNCIKAVPLAAKAPLFHQWFKSAKDHFGGFFGLVTFDPNQQSNPTHVFFNKLIEINGNIRVVKNIAMGTPTIETGIGLPEIVPEFEGFLRMGKKHLYVNCQRYIPCQRITGDESARCQALHDLAENETFKENLFVITLSQNSEFYTQEKTEPQLPSNLFKKELIEQMFDRLPHESGNCIPPGLVEKYGLREWSVKMTDKIHEILFANQEQLGIEERRIFIRLFNQNLIRKIMIETQVTSYNFTCKDHADRGASLVAEDYAYFAILENCAGREDVVKFFEMLVFVRAIIVRKRTMIESHLLRLLESVKFMTDHQRDLQELQAVLFPGITLTIDQFDSPP